MFGESGDEASLPPRLYLNAQITSTAVQTLLVGGFLRTRDNYYPSLSDYRGRIESGESKFAELASTESDCSSARKGGDLGVFGHGQMQSK